MKNFIQPGEQIEVTLAAAVASGEPMLIGSLFGVAVKAGEIGEKVVFSLEGVFELTKVTADVMAQGAKVYWDNTAKKLTTTAMGNSLVGVAWAAAGNGDTKVQCRLDSVSI